MFIFLLFLLFSTVLPFSLESPERSLDIARAFQNNLNNASYQRNANFLHGIIANGFKFEGCRGAVQKKKEFVEMLIGKPQPGTVTEARADKGFVIYKVRYAPNRVIEVMIERRAERFRMVRAQNVIC